MDTARMTSIRQLLADVLKEATREWDLPLGDEPDDCDSATMLADALLASPELAAILDAAAAAEDEGEPFMHIMHMEPEMRVLLADWRANR